MQATFTIRTLLLVTAILSVCALMVRTSDWIAALGVAIAASILFCASRLPLLFHNRTRAVALRSVLVLVATGIGWFAIVDFSHWYEWCDHCTEHRFVNEYRVCGIPIWTSRGKNHVDNMSRLRTDLGMPCDHKYQRLHLVRGWGLIYYARPRIGITCCLSGDPGYYSEQVSQRAQQFAIDDPNGARQLYERVVNSKDYDAMHAFIATMKKPESEWRPDTRINAAEPNDAREPD